MHNLNKLLTLIWGLSLSIVVSASTLDGVCSNVAKLVNCRAVIRFPTAGIKYCNQDFFRIDKCKTRLSGRYPCGVSIRGVKFCTGWTCVPGTVKTVIRVPCGLKIGSVPLDLCAVARSGIPNSEELTRTAKGVCSCLPKILNFIDLDDAKNAVTSLDASAAVSSVLGKFGEASQCLVDNGFNIEDNKAGLFNGGGALAPIATTKIFTAAEINLARYISFAEALSPCVTGACQPELIRAWFTTYLTDSEKEMGTQIKAFLAPWEAAFNGITGNFVAIGEDMDQIKGEFGNIQQSVQNITTNFCSNVKDCTNSAVSKLNTKVTETVKASEAFIGLKEEIAAVLKDSQDLAKIVSEAISAFDTLSDLGVDAVVEKVISGQIKSIKDVADTLQAAKRLPDIITNLQKTVPNVEKYIKKLQDTAPDFAKNIENIVSDSWLSDARAGPLESIAPTAPVESSAPTGSNPSESDSPNTTPAENNPPVQSNPPVQNTAPVQSTAPAESTPAVETVAPEPTDASVASRALSGEEAVTQIQSIFKDKIVSHVTAITGGISALVSAVQTVTTSGSPSIEAPRVASYQRWSKGHFAMPCLTTGKITFTFGKFKAILDYPKFYRCEQNYRIPFPNHHIPYIKITFGSAPVVPRADDGGVDALNEPNAPEVPTITDADNPNITEAPEGQPAPVAAPISNFDPAATEQNLESMAPFTTPTDAFTNSADVPPAPTADPKQVFFETTDANGANITSTTALPDGSSLEVTSTEVNDAVSTESGAGEQQTPTGFEEGTLAVGTTPAAPKTADGTATKTGTTPASKTGTTAPSSTAKKGDAPTMKPGFLSLLATFGVFVFAL